MGLNFTPLQIPHSPAQPPPRKDSFNKRAFALLSGLILFIGVVSGYLALSNGLLYRSSASTGFNPIDRRPYENCYQPFMTYLDGASVTINKASGCENLPPISIDVWKMNPGSFDNQSFVWHKEFAVKPGSNRLDIPGSVFNCTDFYQIDSWLGTGTPPANANYGYALMTATFVKPAGSNSCGTIPAQYCNSGATITGPTSCNVPSATPSPKLTSTPTPKPSATPSPNPKCGASCTSDSQCPNDMKCDLTASGNHTSPLGKCVLTKCTQAGTTCTADKCNVIVPTVTNSCPKPNPVRNLRITCPICKGA